MPSGLFALLDDVATIAKVAAASIDDIGAAAAKAGAKAAGVVVDDAAVTPRYVTGFTPDRELPIIWRIARGSIKNKLIFILPVALLLSVFAKWAITPVLMIGGAYLCFEGAEKVWHAFSADKHSLEEEAALVADKDHEETMVAGAIRTDFILSAEIMVIALYEVMDRDLWTRGFTLALVAVAITVIVYGVVGLIVKMDDIGLHMAKEGHAARRSIGRGLVAFMPKLLAALGLIGTAAMLWVGGQIVLHGLDEYGLGQMYHALHHAAEVVASGLPVAGLWEWLINTSGQAVFGLLLGGIIVAAMHVLPGKKAGH
jgi:predicted DNA repair protein MutK